ncbi:MAG: PKD domain-containing protein [Akkermansiaceae bacterium]|nr:PKD domain-containing protein [Akkermansiaceae bacterium]
MKRLHRYLPALPVWLLLLLLLWHFQTPPASNSNTSAEVVGSAKPAPALTKNAPLGRRTSAASAVSQDFSPRDLSDLDFPKRADLRWREIVAETVFEDFRRWTENLRIAGAGVDLQQGIKLAQQRRHELLALIEKDPRRALELAVPDSVRQQLPKEIVALLEERVDANGDLLVQSTTLDNDRGCMTTRAATLQDGRVFDTHTYGRRGAMPTRDNIAIHGVALDGKLAMSEFAGRVLEPSEVATRAEAGRVLEETQEQTDAADGPVIAFGADRMIRYPDEFQAIAALLDAASAEQSGATAALAADLDGVIAASPWTEGQKTLLIIRVDFSDFPGQVVSDATLGQLIVDMNTIYTDMSSGKSSYALVGQGSAITTTVRMPKSSSNYASWTSLSNVLNDARVAAAAAGFNYLNYTHEVVVTGATPVIAGTAGVARVGARGAWLHNSQWNLKTCAHEVGHNFGLPHSGAWDTDDGSVIGTGEVWDYGNVFDMMGVGSSPHTSRHFGASLKQFLNWMPVTDLVKITTNGTSTTRIRAMDKPQADGNKRALVVDRANSSDDYWIEHRQLYGTSYGMQNGVLVNWASINGGYQQPLLLDMLPTTSEKTDAVLPIGKTFSDTAAGIHITPVARGTDSDGVNWVDVTVNRGIVSGNFSPTASISGTNANPAINVSVNFTCTASDPNGDTLAYFWDWGNGTTTATNNSVASKSWPATGIYTVKCTVSDMKGLTTTANYVVQVGATTTFFIDGFTRTMQGNPLAGVVVTASPTTLKGTSDVTGRYTITGLAAGTYTLVVSSGIPVGFTNPVTVGPSLQERNFEIQTYPLTWDVNSGVAGAQDGGGTWANSAGNWLNQTTNLNTQWNNASLDTATFGAGTDGAYAVTLSGSVQASGGITFANSGYTLSGAALSLVNGTLDGAITVAAGKTATINSTITYANNAVASITVNSGAVLNLGGGASNSQYNFIGSGGTVNMTAGTYTANVGSMTVTTFNQTGGTFNITPGNNNGYNVSSNTRNLNYTLSGGTLTVNGNLLTATVNNAYLGIGSGTAISNTSTMTVKSGATVNVGTIASTSGEIRIANTPESNGTLDVQGGTLTVGTGSTANKIYFFKAGTIDAPYLARMSQSGGTVTANGIQFGGDSGAYDPASSAALQLSGGSLYIGLQGITRGSAAGGLAVAIQLQGGTIGASDSWSSSLNMQLSTTAGGPIFQAATIAGASKNITLTGILSDDSGAGTFTKTGVGTLSLAGANTFTGGVTLKNGTLESKTTQTTLGTGTVTMGGSGSTGASFITGQSNSNPFAINAPDSGSVVIGANGSGSGFTMSGGITLNGNLTLQTYNNTISGTTKAVAIFTGGISGTGNVLLNNIGLAANTITIATTAINHIGSLTLQGTATGDTTLSANIGTNVTGINQNSATSLMILGGANTYACNLTVNAGKVRISNNTNTGNDVSTVTLAATGATLDLTYTGTDKVNKLFIGNTQQANGVYGKVGSASPVIGISQITGDGTLTVGPVTPAGFASWIAGTFANGAIPVEQRGPSADPDNDGVSNLVEYATAGQDPTVGNPAIGTFNGSALSFSKRLDATGITYDIESSTLLTAGSWTTLAKPPVLESSSAISYIFTPGTPVKNFARLKVIQLP